MDLHTSQLIFAAEMGAGAAFAAIFSAMSIAFGSDVERNYNRLLGEMRQRPPIGLSEPLELRWMVENINIPPKLSFNAMIQPVLFRIVVLVIIAGSILAPLICLVQNIHETWIVKTQVSSCIWLYLLAGFSLMTASQSKSYLGRANEWERIATDEEMNAARAYSQSTAPSDHAKLGNLVRELHGRLTDQIDSQGILAVFKDERGDKPDLILVASFLATGAILTFLTWM